MKEKVKALKTKVILVLVANNRRIGLGNKLNGPQQTKGIWGSYNRGPKCWDSFPHTFQVRWPPAPLPLYPSYPFLSTQWRKDISLLVSFHKDSKGDSHWAEWVM